jgi:hypothetical protein
VTYRVLSKRTCPRCGGRKGFYAEACRRCKEPNRALLGRKGPNHPAWKGGKDIDRDGYVRTYSPEHPWPRSNGYVREHVRVMELHIGRRIGPDEVVHHSDHDKLNNELGNLELLKRGEHSSHHRAEDTHKRERDALGRFA